MTDCIGTIYAEDKTELLWSIGPGSVYHDNQTRQWHYWSYRYNLCWKQNWAIMIDWIGCGLSQKLDKTTTWSIVQVQPTSEMKLSYRDQLDLVWSMIKTRKDNNVTNRIGLVYVRIETELMGSIWSSAVHDENKIGQRCDRSYRCVLCQKETKLLLLIGLGVIRDEKQDRTTMLLVVQLWSKPKTILKFRERLDRVSTVIKT